MGINKAKHSGLAGKIFLNKKSRQAPSPAWETRLTAFINFCSQHYHAQSI